MLTLAFSSLVLSLAPAQPAPTAQPAATAQPAPTAQPAAKPTESAPAPGVPVAATFPATWQGHWKGESSAAGPGRDGMKFGTELIIDRTDDPSKWTWTLIYDGAAGRQERKYTLAGDADSARSGRWKIDENNGIVLDASYILGGLFCRFEVQGSDISVSYRIVGEGEARRLLMELVTCRTAGTQTGGKDQTPPVTSYSPISVQRVEMRLAAP